MLGFKCLGTARALSGGLETQIIGCCIQSAARCPLRCMQAACRCGRRDRPRPSSFKVHSSSDSCVLPHKHQPPSTLNTLVRCAPESASSSTALESAQHRQQQVIVVHTTHTYTQHTTARTLRSSPAPTRASPGPVSRARHSNSELTSIHAYDAHNSAFVTTRCSTMSGTRRCLLAFVALAGLLLLASGTRRSALSPGHGCFERDSLADGALPSDPQGSSRLQRATANSRRCGAVAVAVAVAVL